MSISKQDIFNSLSKIVDPIGGKDLVSSGFFKELDVESLNVNLKLELPGTYTSINQQEIKQLIISELTSNISEDLIFDIKFLQGKVGPTENKILPNIKNIIAIASGKGGVGKSTVTSNLAVALADTGAKVGVVDADIFGPSVPTMFGVEGAKPNVIQHEGRNMLVPIETHGVSLMSIGFVAPPGEAVIWRGAMASSALKQFFLDTDWGELDYLLIDLPPGTSDIHLTLVQSIPVTSAVVVTTPQKVSAIDASKALSMFKKDQINVPVLGIVENMAYFTPEELPDNKYYLFGKDGGFDLAKESGVPFLGQIPIVQSIRESGDAGTPGIMGGNKIVFDAFTQLASEVIKQNNVRNKQLDPTEVVKMVR